MPQNNTDPFTRLAYMLRRAPLEPELKLSIIEAASQANTEKLEHIIELVEGFVDEIIDNEKKLKNRLDKIQETYKAKSDQFSNDTNIELNKLSGLLEEDENSAKLESLRKSI